MVSIGGNITALLQVKNGSVKNRIGEKVQEWRTVHELTGFLDLRDGESKYQNYSAKVEESSHVFICDYTELDASVRSESARMIIGGQTYDVMLIDDPMFLHYQLEIYLRYTGAQS